MPATVHRRSGAADLAARCWSSVLAANLVADGLLLAAPRAGRPAAAPPPVPPPGGCSAAGGAGGPPARRLRGDQAGAGVRREAEYAATADLPAVEAEPVTETLEPPPGGRRAASRRRAPAQPTSNIVTDDLPSAEQLMASGAISGADTAPRHSRL